MLTIPAILTEDYDDLVEKLEIVKSLENDSNLVHIDICDGEFVPIQTFEFPDPQDQYFPFWEELDFEIHLMVKNPEEVIEDWIQAGAMRIIIHPEVADIERCIEICKDRVDLVLAIKHNTDIQKEMPKSISNRVLVMGIDPVGIQGSSFKEKTYDIVKQIKEINSEAEIFIDGGVHLDNIENIKDSDVSGVVVGSELFAQDDIKESFEKFSTI